jgi:diguanylate cyclase (GGDEF)-like protein/PAS domain S-box-containing protein
VPISMLTGAVAVAGASAPVDDQERRERPGLMTGLVPKFTLFISLLLIAFAVALSALTILPQERMSEQQLRQRGATMLAILANVAGRPTDDERGMREIEGLVRELANQDDVLYVGLLDWDGSLIVGDSASGADAHIVDAISRSARLDRQASSRTGVEGVYLSAPVVFRSGQIGAVSVGLSHDSMLARVADLRDHTIRLAALFLLAGVLLTYLLMRRVTRPLAQLIESTKAVSLGRLDARITVQSRDELSQLADAFNRMLDRLDATTVSRDYMTDILQSMSEALVVLTRDGRVALANRAMCRLVGYAETELRGMLFERLLDDQDGAAESVDLTGKLQRGEVIDHVEANYVHCSGYPVAVLVSGALMRDSAGTVQAMICNAQDNRERKQHEAQVRQLAYFDTVTGLPNRVQFHHALDEALQDARRHGTRLAVLFLDLDRFKRINDTLGHAKGDHLLEIFADRLAQCVRPSDTVARGDRQGDRSTVARLGGDEFTILLRRIDNSNDAARVASRILEALGAPFELSGHEVVVDASIGIALYPDDGRNADGLLMHADLAMYHAKSRGRANFQFYHPDLNAKAMERLWLESELRRALTLGQLALEFQPQLDLRSDQVIGVEALLRWHHPERGRIPPEKFIPLAEESGLIGPIGAWVLSSACTQAKAWLDQGFGPIRIAVNISSEQLRHVHFVDQVAQALADSGLPPQLLELEITESTAMAEPEIMVLRLTELKRMGIDLAIDDFGTGYSSLAYLQRFPLDRLKIDRSFVRHVVSSANDAGIVTAIIAMAHQLSFEVIAEGVETDDQLTFLRTHRCDQVQGYLASPPLTAERFVTWLRNRTPVSAAS